MPRTTAVAVKAILGDNYGKSRQLGANPDLSPFIEAAGSFVDDVIVAGAADGRAAITAAKAELLERWIAAHCYLLMDQAYQQKGTEAASATFQGQTGMYLEGTKYGQFALRLDTTGVVEALDKRKVAGSVWLGKPPSQQIPYDQRN